MAGQAVRLTRAAFRWGRRIAVTVVLALALAYVGLGVLGYQPMVIVTGSMQKTIPVGSLVVDRSVDPSVLRVGDVISFEKPLGAHGIDTHRIVAITNDGGRRFFRTKGDSNSTIDPWVIRFDRGMKAHRMTFSLPKLGYALLVARSPAGRLALLAYACLAILLSLLRAIAAMDRRGPEAETLEVEARAPAARPPQVPPRAFTGSPNA